MSTSGPPSARRAWLSITAMTVALLGIAFALQPFSSAGPTFTTSLHLTWWMLAALTLTCDAVVLDIQVRNETQAFSLNELATVVGLFFASGADFMIGRTVGALAAMVLIFRLTSSKLVFNSALTFFEASVAVCTFNLLTDGTTSVSGMGWVAALAAVGLAALTTTVALSLLFNLMTGTWSWASIGTEPLRAAATSVATSTVGLVLVHALAGDEMAIVPIVFTLLMVLVGFRAYSGLAERHLSLERLYHFSHMVTRSPEVDDILIGVLTHAQEVLRADRAEVVFFSPESDQRPVRILLDAQSGLIREVTSPDEDNDPVWQRVIGSGTPLLLPRGVREPGMRAFLASRRLRDAMLAPLQGDTGIVGTILVGDRLGEVRSFDEDDLRMLETVANHSSMALQNGVLSDRLRHDSQHDPLTGLPNRATFTRALGDSISDVRSHRSQGAAALVIDLVGFKTINDNLGHSTGDELLREVAVRLAAAIPENALAARLGGDEYAVLVPGLTHESQVHDLATSLRETLEHPARINGIDIEIGISIGACLIPDHGLDGIVLMRRADAALAEAQATGCGVQLYSAHFEPSTDPASITLVSELRTGIDENQLELHVQPQASVRTGAIVAVEALVRWRHPEKGLLFPDEFIPVAERTGLIRPLTQKVLAASIAAAGGWWRDGIHVNIAVNLSPRCIVDANLVENVSELLREHRLPAHALCLEITESCIIGDPERTTEVLRRLHALGVRLSIDDFGTGYTSLAYLRHLPVQEVKVDKSFVMTMRNEGEDAAIVRSIIDLAGNLKLEVVAEGVEDADTWSDLADMGCDLVQGYHLSRPMPMADFLPWEAKYRTANLAAT